MYCKFCGSDIAPESSVCTSCGAVINRNDYGQTFFNDKELEIWESKSVDIHDSNVPKTEIRDEDVAPAEPNMMYPSAAIPDAVPKTEGGRSLSFRGLSSSNKLVVFCIVSAVIIVLLVVSIVMVIQHNIDKENDAKTDSNTSTVSVSDVVTSDQTTTAVTVTSEDIIKNKTADNVVIQVNGTTVESNIPVYMYDDRSFVPVDNILSHMNYQFLKRTDAGEIIYVDGVNNKIIIKANSTDFSKVLADGITYTYKMDLPCFNDGAITYVHSGSFFRKLGYSVDYKPERKILILTENH